MISCTLGIRQGVAGCSAVSAMVQDGTATSAATEGVRRHPGGVEGPRAENGSAEYFDRDTEVELRP